MAHRKQHKKECKKRAAALLFNQLPEVTLNLILSYSVPRIEKRVWPWIATLRRTCKTFNRLAKSLAPSSFCVDSYADFYIATGPYIDVRTSILQSMNEHSWMRENLKELHIDWSSILGRSDDHELTAEDEDIRPLLRTLLTTPGSLPSLEWLDINLQSDWIYGYKLIDTEAFAMMPIAMPALKNLCLSHCFESSGEKVSPDELKKFFRH